jgi:hypothetical protein
VTPVNQPQRMRVGRLGTHSLDGRIQVNIDEAARGTI